MKFARRQSEGNGCKVINTAGAIRGVKILQFTRSAKATKKLRRA